MSWEATCEAASHVVFCYTTCIWISLIRFPPQDILTPFLQISAMYTYIAQNQSSLLLVYSAFLLLIIFSLSGFKSTSDNHKRYNRTHNILNILFNSTLTFLIRRCAIQSCPKIQTLDIIDLYFSNYGKLDRKKHVLT